MRYFKTVILKVEYPDGMLNNGDANPTGSGVTTPLTEVSKIIESGCGDSFNCNGATEKKLDYDAIYVLKEV